MKQAMRVTVEIFTNLLRRAFQKYQKLFKNLKMKRADYIVWACKLI